MTGKLINPHLQMAGTFRRVTAPLLDIVLDIPGLFTIHRVSEATAPQHAETPAQSETDTAEVMDGDDDIYIIPVCPWW